MKVHPRTTPMLDELGLYPSYEMLCRNLRILRRRGLIRHRGTVQLKGSGRPLDYYCGWAVRPEAVLHELEITDIADELPGEWRRGRALSAEVRAMHKSGRKDVWPDAILVRSGAVYWLEYDTTEQTITQVREKLAAYEGFPHKLLFVTRGTKERLEHVAAVAGPARPFALFTTLDYLIDPKTKEHEAGAVWYGASLSKAVALPD